MPQFFRTEPVVPQPINPLESVGQALTLKSMLRRGQLEEQELQERDILRKLAIESGGDLDKMVSLGSQRGVRPDTLVKLQNLSLERKEKLRTAKKSDLDIWDKQSEIAGATALAILEVEPAKRPQFWQVLRPRLAQHLPPELLPEQLPDEGALQFIAASSAKAREEIRKAAAETRAQTTFETELPGKQAEAELEQMALRERKQLGGLTVKELREAKERERHQRATEALTKRGQDMVDARQRELNAIARDSKLNQQQQKDVSSLAGFEADVDRLAAAANELKTHPGLAGITGIRGAIPNIPGSQAANAEAKLNTLKSQTAFSVLQNMRNNSKTGGALGQVSERELSLLEANLGALDKAQSKEEFEKSLQQIITYAEQAKERGRRALERQYNLEAGKLGGSAAPAGGAQGIKIKRDAQGRIIAIE